MWDLSLPLRVAIKQRVHHDGAACVGEQLAAQANESAARHTKFDSHAPIAMIVHVGYFAFARTELLHHYSDKFFWNVDREVLDGLQELAVNLLGHDFRFPDHQFVTFSPHHFKENRELKLAPPEHLERVRAVGFLHAQRDVCEQFFLQSLTQV